MRPVTISLDQTTWELAQKKSNFSDWVRNKLRSERNSGVDMVGIRSQRIERMQEVLPITTAELLYHLERRSEGEITALVSILQGSLPQQ
jgi:hypothetical protein